MKIVLAIEGIDGAGKSSLAQFLQRLCEQHHQSCTPIGRREVHSSSLVGKLSRLIKDEARHFTPQAEIMIRMARDFERAHLAAAVPRGIVVLDRFVLSILALAQLNGHDIYLLHHLLKEIVTRAHLHATILVHCPFDVALSRVKERSSGSWARRHGDERLLRKLGDFIEQGFQRGLLTGQQWLVDNSQTLAMAEEQLTGYMLPYLSEG